MEEDNNNVNNTNDRNILYSREHSSQDITNNNTNNNTMINESPTMNPEQRQQQQQEEEDEEEIGRDFASRKIELTNRTLRFSQASSQNPLIPRHDIHRYYHQSFVASTLSSPTLATVNVVSGFTSMNTTISHDISSSPSSSTPSSSSLINTINELEKQYTSLLNNTSSTLLESNHNTDGLDDSFGHYQNNNHHRGILLDQNCSMVMPSSEPNKRKQKPKRRVQIREEKNEYFTLPPIDDIDDISSLNDNNNNNNSNDDNNNNNNNSNDNDDNDNDHHHYSQDHENQYNSVHMNHIRDDYSIQNDHNNININENTYQGIIDDDINDLYERDSVSTMVSDDSNILLSRNQSIFNIQSASQSMDGRSSSLSAFIPSSTASINQLNNSDSSSISSSNDSSQKYVNSLSNHISTSSSNDSAISESDSYITAGSSANLPLTTSIPPSAKTNNTIPTNNSTTNNNNISNLQLPLYNNIQLPNSSIPFTQNLTDTLLTRPTSSSSSLSSSSISLPSSLPFPLTTSSSYTNLTAFQRKGKNISKNTILGILENGSSTNKLNHHKSKSSLYPINKVHTEVDVENEIKKAIEIAKLSNKLPSTSLSISSSSTNLFIQQRQQQQQDEGMNESNDHTLVENNSSSNNDRSINNFILTSSSSSSLLNYHDQNKNLKCTMDKGIISNKNDIQKSSIEEKMDVKDIIEDQICQTAIMYVEDEGIELEDQYKKQQEVENNNNIDTNINNDEDGYNQENMVTTLQDLSMNINNNGNQQYLLQISTSDIDQQKNFNIENGLPMISISSDQSVNDFGETLLDELERITLPSSPLPLQGSSSSIIPNIETTNVSSSIYKSNNKSEDSDNDFDDNNMDHSDSTNTSQDTPHLSTITNHDSIQSASTICQMFDETQDKHLNMKLCENDDADSNQVINGRLFIKVLAAENLDLPIDYDSPYIHCTLNSNANCLSSGQHRLQHTVPFNHDFVLDNVKSDDEIALILQVNKNENNTGSSKKWGKKSSFTSRTDDLLRYINKEDGAVAQTRISLSDIFSKCRRKLCSASFALVNGWYRPAKKSNNPLLLSKVKREKKHNIFEKAIGKITVELFYIPKHVHPIDNSMTDNKNDIYLDNLPDNIKDCELALNIQRFHKTIWNSGYLHQNGGDVKFWRRRYFKLIGGQLYSYSDNKIHAPRTMIDLSKAIAIITENKVLLETSQHQQPLYSTPQEVEHVDDEEDHLLMNPHERLNSQSKLILSEIRNQNEMLINDDNESIDSTSITTTLTSNNNNYNDDYSSYLVKNGFQLKFDTGDIIEFFCDSAKDREKWLGILKAILGRIPPLPTWL